MASPVDRDAVGEQSDDRSQRIGRRAALVYRVLITVAAALLFNQAILAGQFMSGTFEALEFHRLGASASGIIALLATASAGLARFRKRYALWPTLLTASLFVAIQVEEFAGEQRMLAVHIPLGVAIIMAVSWLTVWAWRES